MKKTYLMLQFIFCSNHFEDIDVAERALAVFERLNEMEWG